MEWTVARLLEKLKSMDPEAVICHTKGDTNDGLWYSSIDIVNQLDKVAYIDEEGHDIIGNIVTII